MKSIWLIAGIAGALVFAAFAAYFLKFQGSPISGDPSDWAQFGSYTGGVLGPPLAFLGLLGLIYTVRIQFSTLKQSESAFKQQQNYMMRKEKKEEWMVCIRDAEAQIVRYLALPVRRSGVKMTEISNLINLVYDRMNKANRLKDIAFADEIMKEFSDEFTTARLNGLGAY